MRFNEIALKKLIKKGLDNLSLDEQISINILNFIHTIGQSCGICDEYGHPQQFPAAFRKTRDTFKPKGIVKIIK